MEKENEFFGREFIKEDFFKIYSVFVIFISIFVLNFEVEFSFKEGELDVRDLEMFKKVRCFYSWLEILGFVFIFILGCWFCFGFEGLLGVEDLFGVLLVVCFKFIEVFRVCVKFWVLDMIFFGIFLLFEK